MPLSLNRTFPGGEVTSYHVVSSPSFPDGGEDNGPEVNFSVKSYDSAGGELLVTTPYTGIAQTAITSFSSDPTKNAIANSNLVIEYYLMQQSEWSGAVQV